MESSEWHPRVGQEMPSSWPWPRGHQQCVSRAPQRKHLGGPAALPPPLVPCRVFVYRPRRPAVPSEKSWRHLERPIQAPPPSYVQIRRKELGKACTSGARCCAHRWSEAKRTLVAVVLRTRRVLCQAYTTGAGVPTPQTCRHIHQWRQCCVHRKRLVKRGHWHWCAYTAGPVLNAHLLRWC